MTDAWPDDLPHGVIDFEPVGGTQNGGAVNGLPPAIGPNPAGPHWRATVSQITLRTALQIAAARALEGMLDGGAGSVEVPFCDAVRPTVVSASFAADYPAGTTQIALNYDGDTLRGGEHFSPEGETIRRGYRLVEQLGGGVWRIVPPLRVAGTSGQVLDFATPSCAMALESGLDLPIDLGRFGSIEATFTEYFQGSPAIAPAPPEPETPPGDARYWRVRAIHTHDGDALFSPADFRFLDDWAGVDIGGTPISSALQGGTHLVDAFDGSGFTYVSLAGSGGWIGVDMGSPTPRTKEFYLTAPITGASPSQMPSSLAYDEGVDDGSGGIDWTNNIKVWSGMPAWIENERRFFAIDDEANAPWDGASPVQWRRQRVRALTVGSGSQFGLEELWLLDVLGGSTPISGNYRGYLMASGDPVNLLDNSFTTTASVNLTPGGWFWCDNGLSPRDQIVQILMTSIIFFGNQAPLTFVLEGENWAGDWQPIQNWTTSAWPNSPDTARRFDV